MQNKRRRVLFGFAYSATKHEPDVKKEETDSSKTQTEAKKKNGEKSE